MLRPFVVPFAVALLLPLAAALVYHALPAGGSVLAAPPNDSREGIHREGRLRLPPLPEVWGGQIAYPPPQLTVTVEIPPPPRPAPVLPLVTVLVPQTPASVQNAHSGSSGSAQGAQPGTVRIANVHADPVQLGATSAALPGLSALTPLNEGVPVAMTRLQVGRVQVALLRGGLPVSRHVLWRSSVVQFIKASGAVAGVNGTFFKDAAIASNDSNMMGPLLTADGTFLRESDAYLLGRITGRPLVAWSNRQFLVTAFRPATMNSKAQVQALLPGVTDAFVAGAWLVRGGHAISAADMKRYASSDAQEVRPRVFFGVTKDGLGIAGATITPVSSAGLARIAEQVGAQEAVLMDSGYSTSLIYGAQVLAVGHASRKVPSRPVPHAIVFFNPTSVQAQGKPVPGK
ncbi:phosphodiester glycosidase family protein [Deinococcus sp. KNUC1210]|uniref:phosphodiester glycosidase family protein n=1 Tax=Deinococcus sp. KNUC1210 TaxID=2917691 RepID=UPI001EF1183A|nr:phosphodiester glycosidase family protein [Deinococcus sp. KNUC1210]ULH16488.1 phosphodiester glycosidase family protein [Deinococcus sp. KNUC1210]